jgi:transcriptional regulator with XRE-family HTH domain
MTQQELAAKLGVSQQTIARWERGERPVPSWHLPALAAQLGARVSDLLGAPARLPHRGETDNWDQVENWGSACIRFAGGGSDLSALIEHGYGAAEQHVYPISSTDEARLITQLEARDLNGWIVFSTLDNRTVFVNPTRLETLMLLSDDDVQMPHYEPPEVYAALSDDALYSQLAGEWDRVNDPREVDRHARIRKELRARYGDELIEHCRELLGASDVREDDARFGGLTIENNSGQRVHLGGTDAIYQELETLETSAHTPEEMNAWNLQLSTDEALLSVRLGAVRLIEVSRLEFEDWQDRIYEEIEREREAAEVQQASANRVPEADKGGSG